MATVARAPRTAASLMNKLKLNLQAVEVGVSLATMQQFLAASGVEMRDLYEIVIPARTLKHRKERNETLSLDESDKLVRLVRVYDFANRVFSGSAQARDWLETPKKRFDGRTPLHMLRTDFGTRMVEEMLGQIEHGMFA